MSPLLQSSLTATSTPSIRLILLFLTAAFSFIFLLLLPQPPLPNPPKSHFHSLFLSLANSSAASRHLCALTQIPHIASSSQNSLLAHHVSNALSFALRAPSRIVPYFPLLSFPRKRSLTLTFSSGIDVRFDLVQEVYSGDPFNSSAKEAVPTFHAYAKSGDAVAQVVYANYGRVEDFDKLAELGVEVNGTIVLARYGMIYRGDIVNNAAVAGAVATVVYTDRKDFGGGGEGLFPDGPGMPESGVQIGSVFRGIGDPTTPGWPSTDGCERSSSVVDGIMPGIPSLPVSSRDGEIIHRGIGGIAPEDWQGEVGEDVYKVGPGPGILNLSYLGNEIVAMIENVIAVIEGEEEPDRYVILGNHRDAWSYGAVDPNSGTAALLELAERLGKLQEQGWRLRRTIMFCNWDAEEYGLIGSTEWVEENKNILASRAIAYLNVDIAVSGPGFYPAATPQLDELIKQIAKQVQDPDNSSRTVYDSWIVSGGSPTVGRLGGGGSDYAAFVQHIGVPSVDVTFGAGYPVYHSLYDDFVWMQKYGDPLFCRHVAAASIWGLLALRLADDDILPFNYVSYALVLKESSSILEEKVQGKPVNFAPLYSSIEELERAAKVVEDQKKELETRSWDIGRSKTMLKMRELNDRLMMAERAFTDPDGLTERHWYKHLIYAPSKYNDYGSVCFPDLDDAIEKAKSLGTSESWLSVQHEVWRVARVVKQASLVLNGKPT